MRVYVDQTKCETYGICVMELPDIFRFEPGSKKATVIVSEIPPNLENKCLEVAQKCPANAIYVTR